MNKLPPKYKENLPRVSDILESVYPFKGTSSESFFQRWLKGKGISEEDYMKEASEAGTYIHKQLENYLNGVELEEESGGAYTDLVLNGIEAIENLEIVALHTEHYICTDSFQGTIDCVAKMPGKKKKEKWIIDFKSWNIAKQKFGIENKYKKPTDKLKKATLQLSLYAEAMGIDNIAVIELTTDRYYFHKLKKLSVATLNEYITKFNEKKNSGEDNRE